MLNTRTLRWSVFLVAAVFVGGLIWCLLGKNDIPKEHHNYLAQITILGLTHSNKGTLPVVKFDLTGMPPTSKEVMTLDLVGSNAHSFGIKKSVQFGLNEIDLNVDVSEVVPSGLYDLRIVYSIPGTSLANTVVAAFSDSFEIK